uniref:Uncharacterized protein n=1 Tax=Leersia perrieri TaxID=77586 RepID=A0A0D9X4R2_9ORYZ
MWRACGLVFMQDRSGRYLHCNRSFFLGCPRHSVSVDGNINSEDTLRFSAGPSSPSSLRSSDLREIFNTCCSAVEWEIQFVTADDDYSNATTSRHGRLSPLLVNLPRSQETNTAGNVLEVKENTNLEDQLKKDHIELREKQAPAPLSLELNRGKNDSGWGQLHLNANRPGLAIRGSSPCSLAPRS